MPPILETTHSHQPKIVTIIIVTHFSPNKVAIVAMVNAGHSVSNTTQECNSNEGTNDINLEHSHVNESVSSDEFFENKKFDWNSDQQGLILGSYFYGYLPTQIFGGIIADRYNPVVSYDLGIVMFSIISLFTLLATNSIGLSGIVTIRILCRDVLEQISGATL